MSEHSTADFGCELLPVTSELRQRGRLSDHRSQITEDCRASLIQMMRFVAIAANH